MQLSASDYSIAQRERSCLNDLCLTLAYAVVFCGETVMYITLSFRCVWLEGFTIQVAYIIRNSQMLHSSTACIPNPSFGENG